MENKINIYKQIRAFYKFVFNSEYNITPSHVSLYMFLLNQNNRANWVTWFKCPSDTAMQGSLINSNKTYYKILNELATYNLIELQKGVNNFKAPKFKIVKLKYDIEDEYAELSSPKVESSSVNNTPLFTLLSTPQYTPLHTQLHTQLSTLLPTLIDIPNTRILITIEEKEIKKESKKKPKSVFIPPSIFDVIEFFKENGYTEQAARTMFNFYDVADWHDTKNNKISNWKQKAHAVWFKDENKIIVNKTTRPTPCKENNWLAGMIFS